MHQEITVKVLGVSCGTVLDRWHHNQGLHALDLLEEFLYCFFHRTPSKCYMQSFELEVNQRVAGDCGKPNKTDQIITYGVAEFLSCPLHVYIDALKSYKTPSSLKWYTVSYTDNGREHLPVISYNFLLDVQAHF